MLDFLASHHLSLLVFGSWCLNWGATVIFSSVNTHDMSEIDVGGELAQSFDTLHVAVHENRHAIYRVILFMLFE